MIRIFQAIERTTLRGLPAAVVKCVSESEQIAAVRIDIASNFSQFTNWVKGLHLEQALVNQLRFARKFSL